MISLKLKTKTPFKLTIGIATPKVSLSRNFSFIV